MRGEKGWFDLLLEMLPEGWEAEAKELGAMRCAREVKTPGELLRLLLLYFTEGRSFAGTAAPHPSVPRSFPTAGAITEKAQRRQSSGYDHCEMAGAILLQLA